MSNEMVFDKSKNTTNYEYKRANGSEGEPNCTHARHGSTWEAPISDCCNVEMKYDSSGSLRCTQCGAYGIYA